MTLRVKLEVVPFGDEAKAYEIGRLDIFNKGIAPPSPDGWDQGGYHEYGVIEMTPTTGGLHEDTIIHRRWMGAWALVKKTLSALDIEGPK